VEKDVEQAGENAPDDAFIERRLALAHLYRSLPAYGSADFWTLLESCQEESKALPLEVLVRVLRDAVAREDKQAQRRLFEVIVARLQRSNEQWVHQMLAGPRLLAGEREAFAADLYADLCELLLRALLDAEQRFWEEHFLHCLRFLRKHVYEQLMRREGHWRKLTPGPGYRVPRPLLGSLERAAWRAEFEEAFDVSDERAERAFLAVEQADIAALLLRLPVHLRTIVWLIFWEDHTTKTVGELLGISDRTVRNRLHAALAQLRQVLEDEQEVIDGASA
jgi:RNA polymerase sigma factor (sigma-70 family)